MTKSQTLRQGEKTFTEYELSAMGKGIKKKGSKPYGV